MYMTQENRKKLQVILENALCAATPANVRFDEATQKNFCLLLLSMIYELNAKDVFARPGDAGELCFCRRLHEILINFSAFDIPEVFDREYLQLFANLANNLGSLSARVNHLLVLLNREYAERMPLEDSSDVTMQ